MSSIEKKSYIIFGSGVTSFLVRISTTLFSVTLLFLCKETMMVSVASSGRRTGQSVLMSVSSVLELSVLTSLLPGFVSLPVRAVSVEPDLLRASEADLSLSRTDVFRVDRLFILIMKNSIGDFNYIIFVS